jgi:O-antigen/teichoic acid export membrane protein
MRARNYELGVGPDSVQTVERRGFFAHVNVVFFAQIALYGLAFFLRVLLARALGDDDLGTYALFFNAVLIAAGIANLGIGLGNVYYLNKGTYSYPTLLSVSLFVVAVTAVVTVLSLIVWGLVVGDELFLEGWAFGLYAIALPAVVGYLLLTSFLHATSRFFAMACAGIAQGGTALLLVAGLELADALDVSTAAAAWTISFVVADLAALIALGVKEIDVRRIITPDWDALRAQIRYGVPGQIANLAALFNYRLDQFLVAAFVTRAAVGQYTVAVGLAESVWWISTAVALVLMPRLTEMEKEEAEELTPVACRNTLLLSTVAAVALSAVSPLVINVLFGSEFDDAVRPLVLLMPGIVAGSATRVLGSYLFSQGKITYNAYATLIALGVTVVLDVALIPWLEVDGAAIASSIAYVCALAATLFWYHRVSGSSILAALLPQRADVELYTSLWRRLRKGREPSSARETLSQDQPDEPR